MQGQKRRERDRGEREEEEEPAWSLAACVAWPGLSCLLLLKGRSRPRAPLGADGGGDVGLGAREEVRDRGLPVGRLRGHGGLLRDGGASALRVAPLKLA